MAHPARDKDDESFFEIRPCSHGRGLFAATFIEEGTRICAMKGPIIDYAGVLKMQQPDNALQIGDDLYIDLQQPGVIGNHSCNPNAGIREEDGLLSLVAIKDILPQEEITYDYSTTMDAETEVTFICHCRSSCRRKIEGFPLLPKALQQRYLDLDVVLPFLR